MTADVVAIVCFVFAIIYFVIAGGPAAFRTTCKRNNSTEQHGNDTSRHSALMEKSRETAQSGRSRSSSFHMVGPTAPGVSKMRLENLAYDLAPANFAREINADDSIRAGTKKRATRLNSDIGGI